MSRYEGHFNLYNELSQLTLKDVDPATLKYEWEVQYVREKKKYFMWDTFDMDSCNAMLEERSKRLNGWNGLYC